MQHTRTSFLATGLVPVTSPSTSKEDCPICYEPLTSPVRVSSCNHIFDQSCITIWLAEGAKHNTCPLCKTALFTLPIEETVSPAELRRQQVGQALRISNVVSREPPFEDYGCREWDVSDLMRAVGAATRVLGQGRTSMVDRVAGPCLIDIASLAPAYVAMANLLPALAEARGQKFSDAEVENWKTACQYLWLEVKIVGDRKADAMVMAAVLKNKTCEALAKRDAPLQAGPMGFIDGERGEWFDLLLKYLVLIAWRAQQEKEKKTKKERRGATAQPKKERCAVM